MNWDMNYIYILYSKWVDLNWLLHQFAMTSNDSILDYGWCKDDNETIMKYYNLSEEHPVVIAVHSFILSAIILVGVCSNAFVLFLVAKDKRLRYRSVIASLSVVVVDFLLTIFFHGVALTSTLLKKWAYGDDDFSICHMYSIMTSYFINVRWIALGLIATDRFLTVRFPFHYQRHSQKFLIILTLLVWGCPIIIAGFLSSPFLKPTFQANIPTCLLSCVNQHKGCILLRVFIFTAVLIVGGVVPSVLYTWMYRQGRKLRVKHTLGKFTLQITTSTIIQDKLPPFNEVRKEQQTLLTLIIVYLTVLLTSLPQYLVLVLKGISICAFFNIPIYIHFIISNIFFLSTALDPIVIMRNQDFKIAIKEIFCKRKKITPFSASLSVTSPSRTTNGHI